jgi:hypothetical protein
MNETVEWFHVGLFLDGPESRVKVFKCFDFYEKRVLSSDVFNIILQYSMLILVTVFNPLRRFPLFLISSTHGGLRAGDFPY